MSIACRITANAANSCSFDIGSSGRSFASQSDVTVTFFTSDFTAKPPRWLKLSTADLVRKFNFRHNQSLVSAMVNIDLDLQLLPRNFVTGFSQSTALRRGPKNFKLFTA